jgi:pimeloyl-ACP methyl ester carboxylesterase
MASQAVHRRDHTTTNVGTTVSEIIDTLRQVGLQKVHFLRESASGIFGEALAVKHPDRLLSLTTFSTLMYLPLAA